MTASLRRGTCPTLTAPMQTGDGLLARLNPVAEGLSPEQLIGLCEAALRHGNGVVEVTSRGSFQIRGLTQRSAGELAEEIDALGIAVRSGVPVETGPIAGLDPDEIADPRPLSERIRSDIAVAGLEGRLGPKVSVIVDGGGVFAMDALSADVRLRAVRRGADVVWHVGAGGNAELARDVGTFAEEHACIATRAILTAVAAPGPQGRASKLSTAELAEALSNRGKGADVAPPSERGDAGREPARHKQFFRAAIPLTDGRFATAIALPFGHARAETLIELVKAASTLGISEIRLAPARTLLLLCRSEASAEGIYQAATSAGFITDPADPRAKIAACPGSPACASGHIPARDMAAEIAETMPVGLSVELHVSGCEKRCAKPNGDGLTLLGCPESAALVLGPRGATPFAHIAQEEGADAIWRVLELIAKEKKPGVPDERRMQRLGKRRLAQAFLGKD
jgi:precorrin-3B synthase